MRLANRLYKIESNALAKQGEYINAVLTEISAKIGTDYELEKHGDTLILKPKSDGNTRAN